MTDLNCVVHCIFLTVLIQILPVCFTHKIREFCPSVKEDFKGGVEAQQLSQWAKENPNPPISRTSSGNPQQSLTATLGIGKTGPLLLQDLNYINHMTSFCQRKIPERVVHAKGAGAFGYFVTKNPAIRKYTRAKLFAKIGAKTPAVVRFSTQTRESGSADTIAENRGFAIKFYTDEGNFDLTLLTFPAFDTRDPILFPTMKRVTQRNPKTNLGYGAADLDLLFTEPARILNKLMGVSDLARPKNYRVMGGFSVNTFKLTGGSSGEKYFARFQLVSKLPYKWLTYEKYRVLAGSDPDYMTRDLYRAIARRRFPKWDLYAQIYKAADLKNLNFNPFDATKYLPVKQFPLLHIGTLVLNRNPANFFNDVEQVAFNPGKLVPGIEIGPDRIFQGRVLAYEVAARYPLGSNFEQLPVNKPKVPVHNYEQDGFMKYFGNGDGGPNYFPNSYNGPYVDHDFDDSQTQIDAGIIHRWSTSEDDNYSQVGKYWREEMDEGNRCRSAQHLARLVLGSSKQVQQRFIQLWSKGDPQIGHMIQRSANSKSKETKNQKYL